MLTPRRFRALAASYGAEPQRWPGDVRRDAGALLRASAQARAWLDEARALDAAIAAAGAREDAAHWPPGGQDAALARLRSGVEARIAASGGRRPARRRVGWPVPMQLRWAGLATGGGLAIAAGLLLGSMYPPASTPDTVLAMLQAAPIHILAE